jgi:flagellar basal body-associated protein FliL
LARLKKLYTSAARAIDKEVHKKSSKGWIAVIILAFVVLAACAESYPEVGGLLFVLCLIWAIWAVACAYSDRKRVRQQLVAREEISHPGFAKFYAAWQAQKKKEATGTALAILGVIAAATVATVAAAASTLDNRDEISRRVDEELRRRGYS